MPALMIIFVHIRQGEKVEYRVESFKLMPWYAACTMAFSSPCEQKHSSRFVPLGASELQRGQPPSLQFFTPLGVPLYPVEMMRRSFTISAATFRFMQLDREATMRAMLMKYSSQSGRLADMAQRRTSSSSRARSSSLVPALTRRSSANS